MARMKKKSKTVETARTRLAGLKSIDVNLDLGNGMTVEIYEAKIGKTGNSLETYNTTLSLADEQQNLFTVEERDLKDYSERILLAVAAKYGKDSNEYEQAGGTRKSEKRKAAKPKAPPTP